MWQRAPFRCPTALPPERVPAGGRDGVTGESIEREIIRMRTLMFAIIIVGISLSNHTHQISPYSGQETREIKALSQREIDGYLTGKGMGYAKAAELNHYPGPKHVLDLSEELNLTSEQVSKTKELFDTMKKEAITLGKKLVEKEKELDQLFANKTIDDKILKSILTEIGMLQAKLRYVHLRAHLQQKDILTPHQIQLYDRLRGYRSGSVHHLHHHGEE